MKIHQSFAAAILIAGLTPVSSLSQTQVPKQTPSHRLQSQGPLDSVLEEINPRNRDYGKLLGDWQARAAALTIENLFFWSNVTSLTVLVALGGVCFLQQRAADKKERIASALISQLWNGRVSDKIEIERRTAEHNALVDKYNPLIEDFLRSEKTAHKTRPLGNEALKEVPQVEMRADTKTEIKTEIKTERTGFVRPPGHTPPEPAIWQKTYKAATPIAAAPPDLPAAKEDARPQPMSTTPAPEATSGVEERGPEMEVAAEVLASSSRPATNSTAAVTNEGPTTLSTTKAKTHQEPPQVQTDAAKENFALKQEIRRLTGQVDAFRNNEKNLKARLTGLQQYNERAEQERVDTTKI